MHIALIACSVLAQTAAHAQPSLQDCAQLTKDAERLACYDELAHSTEESFGLQSASVPEPTPEEQIDNIVATVTKATHSPYTGWIVTFDNGQSWKQIGTDSFALREGDSCIIERTIMNAFRLKCGDRERRIRIAREE
jgi:hypothetical protein